MPAICSRFNYNEGSAKPRSSSGTLANSLVRAGEKPDPVVALAAFNCSLSRIEGATTECGEPVLIKAYDGCKDLIEGSLIREVSASF